MPLVVLGLAKWLFGDYVLRFFARLLKQIQVVVS